MNHGALGYLDRGGLWLPQDLLGPMSIVQGSRVFGLYYPTPTDKDHVNIPALHDLMLTPIPPAFWGALVHVVARVWHRPGSASAVISAIRSMGTVLLCECNRSAHRYSTFTAICCFEDLSKGKSICSYATLEERARELQTRIREDCSEHITVAELDEPNDPVQDQPVRVRVMTALRYFAQIKKGRNRKKKLDSLSIHPGFKWLFKPFELKYDDGLLRPADKGFPDVFRSAADARPDIGPTGPSSVFAELDPDNANIRCALIPSKWNASFLLVRFDYTRSAPCSSSRGLLSFITEKLKDDYSIWRMYLHTRRNDRRMESGQVVLFLQSTRDKDFETYRGTMTGLEGRHVFDGKNDEFCEINRVTVVPLTPEGVASRITPGPDSRGAMRYDIFLSYCHENEVLAFQLDSYFKRRGILCFRSQEMLSAGRLWIDDLHQALTSSQEMAVLFTRQSLASAWVHTESGAAWALSKKITPILSGVDAAELPERLRIHQSVAIRSPLPDRDDWGPQRQLDRFIREVKNRRYPPW